MDNTRSRTYSPKDPNVEASQVYNDDWRAVEGEDEDWPSDLIAEVNNIPGQVQQEITTTNASNVGQTASTESVMQPPIKLSLLTRPVSSGQDPAAGFSFTKAKPVQPLDFSRKPKQKAASDASEDAHSRSSHGSPEPTAHNSMRSPLIVTQDKSQAVAPPDRTPPTTNITTSFIPHEASTVPFPNVRFTPPQKPSALEIGQRPSSRNQAAPFTTLDGDASISGNDTLIGSASKRTDTDHQQLPAQPSHNDCRPEQNTLQITREPDQGARHMAQVPLKITKPPRKKPSGRRVPAQFSQFQNAPDNEELLNFLIYRYQVDKHQREMAKATQEKKELELRRFTKLSHELSNQLQEVQHQKVEKEAALEKIKAAVPQWETKIHKLKDYVRGLTNDHHKLRDDAKEIQQQQVEVIQTRQELHDTLINIYQAAGQNRAQSKNLVAKARHNVEVLEQTVKNQETKLQENECILRNEQDKGERLQSEMSRIVDSHGQLVQSFAGHRADIVEQLQVLVNKSDIAQSTEISNSRIKLAIDECVGLLQGLRKADVVQPEDLRKLNMSVTGYCESILQSVQACEQTSNMTEAGQRELASSLQKQMSALNSNFCTENTLSKQVMDLREMKATVRERLQATDTALVQARHKVIALQNREQEQSRKIVALELEVESSRNVPVEESQTLLRLQEADLRNKDLQSEANFLQKQFSEVSAQIQQKDSTISGLESQLAEVQTQLEEARHEAMKVEKEKSSFEVEATAQRERMRQELSKSAMMQLNNVKSEHLNALQQLNLKKAAAERKSDEVSKQVDHLKAEKERLENMAKEKAYSKSEIQKEKERNVEATKSLLLRITELESQIKDSNNKHVHLEQNLGQANRNARLKDKQITDLQTSLDTAVASLKNEQVDQNARASRSLDLDKPPPAVTEDCQPEEMSNFASLEDIMNGPGNMSDPFWGHPEGGSQFSMPEDPFSLFPASPKTHTNNLETNCTSVSRNRQTFESTIDVSEDQVRRGMSRREAASKALHSNTDKTLSQNRGVSLEPKKKSTIVAGRPSGSGPSPTPKPCQPITNYPQQPVSTEVLRPKKVSIAAAASPLHVAPRGILKASSANTTGTTKRSAFIASLPDAGSHASSKKVKETKDLGPILPDSRSPHLLHGRGRKLSTKISKKSTSKDDEMTRVFAREVH